MKLHDGSPVFLSNYVRNQILLKDYSFGIDLGSGRNWGYSFGSGFGFGAFKPTFCSVL